MIKMKGGWAQVIAKNKKALDTLFLGCLVALMVGIAGIASAQIITQSFYTDEQLANGTIVSLDKQDTKAVEKTTSQNTDNLYGVVTEQGDISISQNSQRNQVSVVNSGVIDVLVSTANGDVSAGDAITVKSIEGVGEKSPQSGMVLGIAQQDLNNNSSQAKQYKIGKNSSEKNINIGLIPVKISVGSYSDVVGNAVSGDRNKFEQIADNLAGKTVKPFALVTSAIVLLIGTFVSTFMITTSSYGSIISVGRNPFSEKKIVRSFLLLLSTATVIFGISAIVAYIVLKIWG